MKALEIDDDGVVTLLSDVLEDLGVGNARLLLAPAEDNRTVRETVIVDAEDDDEIRPGALVMLIGVRGRAALPALRRIMAGRPTAVAVKGSERELEAVAELLQPTGIGLVAVAPGLRWDKFESIALDRVRENDVPGETPTSVHRDLFAIAQTTATLTNGHVVIEDPGNRVLAYSPASNDVDELRRLSILARRGPEKYQKLLKESGVYKHLQATEAPVHVEANLEAGLRERVAIGIHAGSRVMGYIWLQEGAEPLAANTDRIMVGAARHAAIELVRHRNEQSQSMREDRVSSLLSGTAQVHSQAQSAGIDPAKPAALVLISAGGLSQSAAGLQLRRGELSKVASIHAAAYRPGAVVGALGMETAIILPDVDPQKSLPAINRLVNTIVRDATTHLHFQVQAAVGPIVPRLDALHATLDHVRSVLKVMEATPDVRVASYSDVETTVLTRELLELLESRTTLRHAGITRLCGRYPEFALTLLTYLEFFGDVNRCAEELAVHRNTVHYRLRRACEVAGLDLQSADERLLAHLQIRLWTYAGTKG
ncbi:sugar diacid utilization regulator [Paenarthrobacter nicotinovorans]|uniref:PucR family transcriptional regulator n=1 Tax=Micrococcaceae TaxID=1268 RepID=UPI000876478D|nr:MULTISPECIES: helix-turn-helix domain-containing protein [Micrococcaceae]MDR6435426.1 sugar diacid utilization regulator [Paenarthrobacter nicotinovorans]SCZ49679.1 PucR C-terminal helix-turn-helix domain-containing protein [Arthrobacter sp. UNCCL28]